MRVRIIFPIIFCILFAGVSTSIFVAFSLGGSAASYFTPWEDGTQWTCGCHTEGSNAQITGGSIVITPVSGVNDSSNPDNLVVLKATAFTLNVAISGVTNEPDGEGYIGLYNITADWESVGGTLEDAKTLSLTAGNAEVQYLFYAPTDAVNETVFNFRFSFVHETSAGATTLEYISKDFSITVIEIEGQTTAPPPSTTTTTLAPKTALTPGEISNIVFIGAFVLTVVAVLVHAAIRVISRPIKHDERVVSVDEVPPRDEFITRVKDILTFWKSGKES